MSVETTAAAKPVPLLDLKAQYALIRTEIREAMERVLESQQFILGPEVEALEREIADYSGCVFGIGVSSGTDALLVALMAIGIEPGDEVIVPTYSFFATAGAVARLGAKPVFVDIDPLTYNLAAAELEGLVNERTRAIVPVHLFGQMADMDPIIQVARAHGLYVIEDAAQAIGAEYKGQRAGSIGHLGCFSFFPSKNLGAFGDAGMVTTNDQALAERVRILRSHGSAPRYYHRVVGGNFRIDALQAAVLRVKFKYLEDWTRARQSNAERYRSLFAETEIKRSRAQVGLPHESAECRHIFNQFVIRTDRRDGLRDYLQANKIGTEIYYPVPLHRQECFAQLGYGAGQFPESERAALETLALPIYPELEPDAQERVVETVDAFFRA